jgi:NADPH:quinone reductase-like Zn-dependent oxidoreductase
VPLAALTAWQSLFDTAQLQPGQRVLIHAGSGGVGHFAVQLAKWKGAYVFATASTKNQDLLRELGVDEPIDYTQQRFEDIARKIDIVLDTLGGETQERSWSVLKKGGVLVSLVQPPSEGESQRTRRPGCAPRRATERRAARRDREDHRLGQTRAGHRSHPSAMRSAPRARA